MPTVKALDSASLDIGALDEYGAGEAPPRIVVNREHPPSRLAVIVKAPDGTPIGRHAKDEPKVGNVLGQYTKAGEMPGGHTESSYQLARDPNQSFPDLALFSTVELQGAGGERLWSGTIRQEPQDADLDTITVKAVGDKQFLEDDETVVGPGFIGADLSSWQEPSTARRKYLSDNDVRLTASSSTAWQKTGDQGEEGAAIVFDFNGVVTEEDKEDAGELFFDGDVELEEVLYWFKVLAGPSGTEWHDYVTAGVDDLYASGTEKGTDHHGATNGNELERFAVPAGHTWAKIRSSRTEEGSGGEALADIHSWQHVKVLGRQGLQLQGDWPTVGYLAKQMIPVIAGLAGLVTKDELLEDDGFVIPHAWFADPGTPMSKLIEVTKYGLLDWFVFADRVLQHRKPGAYGRRWQLTPGSGAPKNAGPDANRIFDRLMVTWQDVDGTTKRARIGPLTDERNAAVAAGRPRGKLLALNGVCEEVPAVRTGTRFFEEAQNLAQSGEATISGYCQDSYGIWWPAAYVQPGDWAADPGTKNYRKITSVNYSDDSQSASVTLGAPPEGLGALEARFAAKLIEVGLG